MFATRRLRDEIGVFDGGFGSIASSTAGAASSLSGAGQANFWQDLSKFQRYIYTLYAYGTACQPTLMLFSASNVDSTSLGSSASSNWTVIDSVNCAVTLSSASASSSTSRYAAVLEVRAEKLFSGVSPIRYVRPVILLNSTTSNGSSSLNGYLTILGTEPAYGTGASQEVSGFVTGETDYI